MKCPQCNKEGCKYQYRTKKIVSIEGTKGGHAVMKKKERSMFDNRIAKCNKCGYKGNI